MDVLEKKIKLQVKNLNKQYEQKKVLDNINFDVYEGEFLGVLGPSGCGKTTLLRILIGLISQSSGEIILEGNDISNKLSTEREMGIIFQNYALFPNMTALENVEYALKNKKIKDSREIALNALTLIGMEEYIDKKPQNLSGGQQQRVAIARTLATNPKIILLDEPMSALDVTNREIMKNELKEIQRKFNSTMIFITHEQEEAFYLSDRIIVMSEGRIEQIATPKEIYNNPINKYVKEFVVDHLDKKMASLLHTTGKKIYEK